MTGLVARFRRLLADCSGTALTEFALAAPLLMTAGLWGVESANQAIVQMRINQIAVLIADNSSRIGENSLLGAAKIYESDINDVLYGVHVQGGAGIDFYDHGRVILSSLEVVPGTTSDQYIHWQRCMGMLRHSSGYGVTGDGLYNHFPGMGPAGEEIVAFDGEAVMFVEVVYQYQPLIAGTFAAATEMKATASFNVRENRDLTQIYQRDASNPDEVADCNRHDGIADFYG
jgi:hypothetical protein